MAPCAQAVENEDEPVSADQQKKDEALRVSASAILERHRNGEVGEDFLMIWLGFIEKNRLRRLAGPAAYRKYMRAIHVSNWRNN